MKKTKVFRIVIVTAIIFSSLVFFFTGEASTKQATKVQLSSKSKTTNVKKAKPKKVNTKNNNIAKKVAVKSAYNSFSPAKKGQVINVTSSLRIRKGANLNTAVVGYLTNGKIIDVIGQENGWYKIKYNSITGYINKSYIKIIVNIKAEKIENSIGVIENTKPIVEAANPIIEDTKPIVEANSSVFQTILMAMQEQVGTPYIYGGSGELITCEFINTLKIKYPDNAAAGAYDISEDFIDKNYKAFDCSGLMQWGFKQGGIVIGRTVKDQINNGIEVPLNNIQPGDLLFISDLSHVGMYIGDGKWIESPKSHDFIRIIEVPWSNIGRARRVITE